MSLQAPEKAKRPSIFSDLNPALNSLFGEILDWMLAPLLLLWPISIVATHHIADDIANQPYDQALSDSVVTIARQLVITPEGVSVRLPANAPAEPTNNDDLDRRFHQVAVAGGDFIAGDAEIPSLLAGEPHRLGEVLFRDDWVLGERVRIAYWLVPSLGDARPVLVQVAETRKQRQALSSRIISGVLLPQFAIIPLAVILVWIGLTRGLVPLTRLQSRIRERRPDDLSPIELRNLPEELRPMIAAFNDMMVRLQDNLDAQQRFIAAAAHQLKTPLTGLKTQTELALRETDCVQLHDYLQRIAGGVDRAAHLTSQLLQLARAEASHETVRDKEPVDLEALVREVTAHCVPRALARNIDLGFEAAEVKMIIFGVPLLLREMIDNLVDNAIKYTPAGGHVTVRLRVMPDWILEVEDTGIGIAKEDRSRIFERFYRALGTGAEGSGLGLAIVREIADLHQAGIVVLDNPAGCGTVVRLVFDNAKEISDAASPA
jgi:two-component system sensor histidine kinase TctE